MSEFFYGQLAFIPDSAGAAQKRLRFDAK